MIDRTMLFLSSFALAMSISIALAMLFGGGLANFNTYGEGWFEVMISGCLGVAGMRRVVV